MTGRLLRGAGLEELALVFFDFPILRTKVSAQEIFMGYPVGGGTEVQWHWDRPRKSSWEMFRFQVGGGPAETVSRSVVLIGTGGRPVSPALMPCTLS